MEGPKQKFKGAGQLENGNTQNKEEREGPSKESQWKEFILGKELEEGVELALIWDSEKWSPNFARGVPLNPVLFSLPQEAMSTISPRPCTSKCVEGMV